MCLNRRWKLFVLLLAGAWIPVTVSCQPAYDGVARIIADPFFYGTIVVDDGFYGHGHTFHFDLFGDHHHDDDDD